MRRGIATVRWEHRAGAEGAYVEEGLVRGSRYGTPELGVQGTLRTGFRGGSGAGV